MMLIFAACEYLEIDPERVVSWRVYESDGYIALVVDNGIKGSPKYKIPLADLPRIDLTKPGAELAPEHDQNDAPEPQPEPDATPRAAELAAEHGLDLRELVGTGAGGRITVSDVKAAIA